MVAPINSPGPARLQLRHLSLALVGLGLWAGVPPRLEAQSGVVRVEENLRAEPNGVVIAVLSPGTEIGVVQSQGNWLEVEVEGWVWTPSMIAWDRGAYNLRVSAEGGENLRSEPNGAVLATLEEGALLEEVERVPGWSQVRRQAWVWSPSVELRGESTAARQAEQPPQSTPSAVAPPSAVSIFQASGEAPVLSAPSGDTLGVLRPGVEMAVTGRQGSWARVRMEGWVWLPDGTSTTTVPAPGGSSAELETVLANPTAYEGRIVTWTLQFVSLEAAEAIRTDFYEGEPFLLTRPTDGRNTRFVYVAVPPESLGQASGLTPLEEITVVGRIRTGSSSLTGSPVLDLVELRRDP